MHQEGMALSSGSKVVHLIRHGQGFHNLLGDLWKDFGQQVDITAPDNPYNRPEVFDPPLTAIGRKQAAALQEHTRDLENVELIVVSPLRRAIETALLACAHLTPEAYHSDRPAVPFVGHPDLHEQRLVNISDRRRSMSEIRRDFPMVDWSMIADEEDPLWEDEVPEPASSVSDRAYRFLLWLRARPESEVVIASHSAWLFTLMHTAVECDDPELSQWFLTGELRSMVLEFDEGGVGSSGR
jgi:broad specificity phosphatase PhoE